MLSRRLLRVKVVKALFGHLKSDSTNMIASEKTLLASIDKTYDLYFQLMELIVEVRRHAESRLETARRKKLPTYEDLNPNTKFVENKAIALLASSQTVNDYLSSHKLNWARYPELIKLLYTRLLASVEKQKQEIEDLKEKLETAEANAGTATPAFDLGSVFMEAQNTANKVVQEAKKAAKQMEDEAKQLQDQVLADANAQAQKLVTNAQTEADTTLQTAKSSAAAMTAAAKQEAEAVTSAANKQAAEVTSKANAEAEAVTSKANAEAADVTSKANAEAAKVVSDAKNEAKNIRAQSADLRESVKTQFTSLSETVQQLVTSLNDLYGNSIGAVNTARDLIDDGLSLVSDDDAE